MSNYHVLQTDEKEDSADVVFHITVPDEANSAGVNLRTAIQQHGEMTSESGTITTRLPWDIGAELTTLQNGGLYEHSETVEFDGNLSVVQKRTVIDSRYNTLTTTIPNIIRSRFCFWGLNRDV